MCRRFLEEKNSFDLFAGRCFKGFVWMKAPKATKTVILSASEGSQESAANLSPSF